MSAAASGISAEKYPSASASGSSGRRSNGSADCQSFCGSSRQSETSTVRRLGAKTRKLTPLPGRTSAPTARFRSASRSCRAIPAALRGESICERLKATPPSGPSTCETSAGTSPNSRPLEKCTIRAKTAGRPFGRTHSCFADRNGPIAATLNPRASSVVVGMRFAAGNSNEYKDLSSFLATNPL